jgi:hypothetical protein
MHNACSGAKGSGKALYLLNVRRLEGFDAPAALVRPTTLRVALSPFSADITRVLHHRQSSALLSIFSLTCETVIVVLSLSYRLLHIRRHSTPTILLFDDLEHNYLHTILIYNISLHPSFLFDSPAFWHFSVPHYQHVVITCFRIFPLRHPRSVHLSSNANEEHCTLLPRDLACVVQCSTGCQCTGCALYRVGRDL